MLTNGKKVWGIWNPVTNKFFTKNGELAIYDDYAVALADLAFLDLSFNPDKPKLYVKVISEGTNAFGGKPIEYKDHEKPETVNYN